MIYFSYKNVWIYFTECAIISGIQRGIGTIIDSAIEGIISGIESAIGAVIYSAIEEITSGIESAIGANVLLYSNS